MKTAGTESIRVVVVREGDLWVAQCLEYDICVQADDLKDISGRLDVALRLESEVREGDLSQIGHAPQYFQDLWEQCPGTYKPRDPLTGCELAICA